MTFLVFVISYITLYQYIIYIYMNYHPIYHQYNITNICIYIYIYELSSILSCIYLYHYIWYYHQLPSILLYHQSLPSITINIIIPSIITINYHQYYYTINHYHQLPSILLYHQSLPSITINIIIPSIITINYHQYYYTINHYHQLPSILLYHQSLPSITINIIIPSIITINYHQYYYTINHYHQLPSILLYHQSLPSIYTYIPSVLVHLDCDWKIGRHLEGAPAARRRRAQGGRPGRRLRRPLPRFLALARADAEGREKLEKLGKLQGKPWKNHRKTMEKPWKN